MTRATNGSSEIRLQDTTILSAWMQAGMVLTYLLSFKGSVKETGIRPPVPVHKERILSGAYSFPSTSFIEKSFPEDCWTEDNRNAFFPRIRGYQSYSGGSLGTVNDRYIQNIAYLRFKNAYRVAVGKRWYRRLGCNPHCPFCPHT